MWSRGGDLVTWRRCDGQRGSRRKPSNRGERKREREHGQETSQGEVSCSWNPGVVRKFVRAVGPQRELSPVSCCWAAALGAAAGAHLRVLTVWTRRERGPMALGCPTVAIGLALADIVIDIEATTYVLL